jgi:alpha-glucosidase
LDIDYMEGFRCFTWNKEYSIQKNGWIIEDGFKTVVIIDPGLKLTRIFSI